METIGSFLRVASSFESLDLSVLNADEESPLSCSRQLSSVPTKDGGWQTIPLLHSFSLEIGQSCSVGLREHVDLGYAIATLQTGDRAVSIRFMERISTIWNSQWKPVTEEFVRMEELTRNGEVFLLFRSTKTKYTRKCLLSCPSIQAKGTEERIGFQVVDEIGQLGHMRTMKLKDFHIVEVLGN